MIKELDKFIDNYTENLEIEFSKTTEIKKEHIKKWREISDLNPLQCQTTISKQLIN